MQTHSIERSAWQYILDSMSRIYEGSTATLEILTEDLGAQMEIERQPLRGMTYDTTGIALYFMTRDGSHFVHRIANPRRVMLEERGDGLVTAIEIDSGGESLVILHLSLPDPHRLLPS
jgi:hypothetical protein